MRLLARLAVVCCLLPAAAATAAEPLRILAWNVDGRDSGTVLEQLREMENAERFDVLALSQVPEADTEQFIDFFTPRAGFTSTLREDRRLVMAWHGYHIRPSQKFELVTHGGMQVSPGDEPVPLVLHLMYRPTGTQLLLLISHFDRSNPSVERVISQQTSIVPLWIWKQSLPVVLLADPRSFKASHFKPRHFSLEREVKFVKPLRNASLNGLDRSSDIQPAQDPMDVIFLSPPDVDIDVSARVITAEGDDYVAYKSSDHKAVLLTIE